MRIRTLSTLAAAILLAAGPASATTATWIPIDGGKLVVPLTGVNDLHFRWVVDGENVIDATPLVESFRFTGVKWGTVTPDKTMSAAAGSVDLSSPDMPLKKGDAISVLFELILSENASPRFTEAYWTLDGMTVPDLAITGFAFTQGAVPKVPLPMGLGLLGAAFASLAVVRRRARGRGRGRGPAQSVS